MYVFVIYRYFYDNDRVNYPLLTGNEKKKARDIILPVNYHTIDINVSCVIGR